MQVTIADRIFAIWDTLSTPEAEVRFRDMLVGEETNAIHEAGGLQTHALSGPDKIQVLTQLARAVGLQNRFDEANTLLDEAENLAERGRHDSGEIEGVSSVERTVVDVRILLERGRVANSSGSPEKAVPYFQEALKKASLPLNDPIVFNTDQSSGSFPSLSYLRVDALHMLAIVSTPKAERQAYANQGVDLAQSSLDPRTRLWLGPLLNNLAWDAMDEGDFISAEGLFQRAVPARRANLDAIMSGKAVDIGESEPEQQKRKIKAFNAWKIAVWSVGHAQLLAGKDDEALKTLTQLLREGDGPSIREDLARLYARRGDIRSATENAKKAVELGLQGKKADELESIIASVQKMDFQSR